ncbi:Sulfite exporter TauE/SafE [Gracilaria domingensis]|nr:Sulfite exporter TauE/SafE [Gracilaria domingensis]
MPLRAYLERRRASGARAASQRERPLLLAGTASAIGFTSGLLGISGGSLFTPVIALLSPEYSFKQVLATSFASMVLPTACAAVSYARMGLVRAAVAQPLLLGAVGGAALGSAVAVLVPDYVLQTTFAAVFTVMGLRIVRAPIAVPDKLVRATAASRSSNVVQVAAAPS